MKKVFTQALQALSIAAGLFFLPLSAAHSQTQSAHFDNPSYGFEFSTPQGWKKTPGSGSTFFKLSKRKGNNTVSISIRNRGKDQLKNWGALRTHTHKLFQESFSEWKLLPERKEQFNGNQILYIDSVTPILSIPMRYQHIFVQGQNGHSYLISISGSNEGFEYFEKDIYTILKSIKTYTPGENQDAVAHSQLKEAS